MSVCRCERETHKVKKEEEEVVGSGEKQEDEGGMREEEEEEEAWEEITKDSGRGNTSQ